MRPIDADALFKKLDGIATPNDVYGMGMANGLANAMAAILNAPTIDAVPVVRCKDCKRCVHIDGVLVCDHALPTKSIDQYLITGMDIRAIVKPDDFCSYGERKDGEG